MLSTPLPKLCVSFHLIWNVDISKQVSANYWGWGKTVSLMHHFKNILTLQPYSNTKSKWGYLLATRLQPFTFTEWPGIMSKLRN